MKKKQKELLDHIKTLNSDILKSIKSEEGSEPPQIEEDLQHWAELGVHTKKDFEKYLLLTAVFELAKDLGGTPDWKEMVKLTSEQLERDMKVLLAEARAKWTSQNDK